LLLDAVYAEIRWQLDHLTLVWLAAQLSASLAPEARFGVGELAQRPWPLFPEGTPERYMRWAIGSMKR
jgi:hypothetical protein